MSDDSIRMDTSLPVIEMDVEREPASAESEVGCAGGVCGGVAPYYDGFNIQQLQHLRAKNAL